jgi:hypothetical protein
MVSFNSGLGPTLSVVAYAAMLSGDPAEDSSPMNLI